MTGNTAQQTFDLGDILRAVAGAMHYPVIILLILLLLAAVALLGWLLAEYFTERRHMKLVLPELLEKLQHTGDLRDCIAGSGLLSRQKAALTELTAHPVQHVAGQLHPGGSASPPPPWTGHLSPPSPHM